MTQHTHADFVMNNHQNFIKLCEKVADRLKLDANRLITIRQTSKFRRHTGIVYQTCKREGWL